MDHSGSSSLPPVTYGFIGIGIMGYGMAQNLRQRIPKESGLIICDVNKDQIEKFRQETAGEIRVARSPKEVAELSDIIITMLPKGPHVKEVFTSPENGLLAVSAKKSILFMESSTIDTMTSLEVNELVTQSGHRFVDAPVSGGPKGAYAASLTFMIGGTPELFEEVRPLAEAMGKKENIYHCGKAGAGLATKQINNYLSAICALGTAEAFNMGRLYGLDPKTLANVINVSTGFNYNSSEQNPVKGVTPSAHASNDFRGGFSIELCKGVLDMAIALGKQVGAKSVLSDVVEKTFDEALQDERCKGKDYRSIYRFIADILLYIPLTTGKFGEKMGMKLDAPPSQNTVRVRMVDTTTIMSLYATSFIKPVMPGHEIMNMPDVAFLIENERLGKKAMFDLGVRKDYWNLPPSIQQRLDKIGAGMKMTKDVKDILTENNISLDSINDVIWSHTHWDHTGDTTLFPSTTNLVYGPDVPSLRPGFPENAKSPLPDALFQNRPNQEITFPPNSPTIGGFPAHDFYSDGSFYLLSTPGHAVGHLCGLARTTPDTFVLMGGDICHFTGDLRPNPSYPLPDPIPQGALARITHPCPASLFLDDHPQHHNADHPSDFDPKTTPYYALSTAKGTVYETPSTEVAQATVRTLIESFDGNPRVMVCLAHDPTLLTYLPTLNKESSADLNDWFARGWKEKCYWGWLNEVARDGKPGREQSEDGWWVGDQKFKTAMEVVEAFGDGKRSESSGGKL